MAEKFSSRARTGAYHTKEGSQDGQEEAAWDLGYEAALASVKQDHQLEAKETSAVRTALNK